MTTSYVFTGRVFPERACVDVPLIAVEYGSSSGRMSGRLTFAVECSQIAVTVTADQDDLDLLTVKNTVEALARSFIDALGYLSGRGYDVELSSVVTNGKEHVVFGVQIPELENAKAERPVAFNDLVTHIGSTPQLSRALGDLREAIRSPADTAFFCYRTVESVMQHFRDNGGSKQGAWAVMRNALLVEESWIRAIQESADAPRHGETREITHGERVGAMDHAWKVVDRFIIFLSRGGRPLNESEFERLCDT